MREKNLNLRILRMFEDTFLLDVARLCYGTLQNIANDQTRVIFYRGGNVFHRLVNLIFFIYI